MGQGNRLKPANQQRPRGWFSRRHKTDEANRAAREKYQREHGGRAS